MDMRCLEPAPEVGGLVRNFCQRPADPKHETHVDGDVIWYIPRPKIEVGQEYQWHPLGGAEAEGRTMTISNMSVTGKVCFNINMTDDLYKPTTAYLHELPYERLLLLIKHGYWTLIR